MLWSHRFRLPLIALVVALGIHSYSSYIESFDSHASRFLSSLELDVEFPSWTGGDLLASDGSEPPTSLEVTNGTASDANDSFASEKLFGEDEKERGPAVVILVANHAEDYRRIKAAIQSLDKYLDDTQKTPLLLFNEGNLPNEKKDWLVNLTKREVHFPEVDFTQFPFGRFRDNMQGVRVKRLKGRPEPWGYWQMCRFWITKIWEHPILDNYSTFMRMDTDSCFTESTAGKSTPQLPAGGTYVYAPHLTNHPAFSNQDLLNTTMEWIKANNHTPANPEMWQSIFNFKPIKAMPAFYNNFEICNIDFFRQPKVMAFQRRISEEAPWGVFRHKWGDAPVRFLTIALFAKPSQIAWGLNQGYGHGAPCEPMWEPPITEVRVVARVARPPQTQGLIWRNSSIHWLQSQSFALIEGCPKEQTVIDVNTVKTMPRDKRFNCPYETLPPTYYCGSVRRPSHHPYRWECRLKKRIFDRIDQFGLRQVPFMMLDLGSAYSDWVLAVGSYAPQSQLVSVEANVAPFRNAFKHLAVNPGLQERVFPLLAAVMSKDRFSDFRGPLVANNSWHGPYLCDDGSDQEGAMNTVTTKTNACSESEHAVPMTTIDMIMSASRIQGALFFIKMDLEGAEYEALTGGGKTFLDPDTRPCIIIVELKVSDDKPYRKAYEFLLEVGYVEYEDIDSGLEGKDSWPPKGALFGNEGNYEFRLPKEELEKCAMRVRQSQTLS